MKASKDELIPLVGDELEKLIYASIDGRFAIDTTLGFRGRCSLIWKKGTEMPEAVKLLGLMRGILNENTDGAGI